MIAVATASATGCGADWQRLAMWPKQSMAETCSQKLVPVLCDGTRAKGKAMAADGLQSQIHVKLARSGCDSISNQCRN